MKRAQYVHQRCAVHDTYNSDVRCARSMQSIHYSSVYIGLPGTGPRQCSKETCDIRQTMLGSTEVLTKYGPDWGCGKQATEKRLLESVTHTYASAHAHTHTPWIWNAHCRR